MTWKWPKAPRIKADPSVDISLVDPKEIAPAPHAGYDRAKTEADKIKQFRA